MVRKSSLLLGLGLGILWWLGLTHDHSAAILWFDAVAAVLSFGVAALVDETNDGVSQAAGPAVLGLGLAVLWIAGMAGRQPAWVNWLNFLFAIAYLGVAIAAVASGRRVLASARR